MVVKMHRQFFKIRLHLKRLLSYYTVNNSVNVHFTIFSQDMQNYHQQKSPTQRKASQS